MTQRSLGFQTLFCLAVLTVMFLVSCSPAAQTPDTPAQPSNQSAPSAPAPSTESTPAVETAPAQPAPSKPAESVAPPVLSEDRGDLKLTYTSTKDEVLVPVREFLKDGKVLEEEITELNTWLALPYDIPVLFSECGEEFPNYIKANHTITVCYEMIDFLAASYEELNLSGEEMGAILVDSTTYTFTHSLGHALIDAYSLPVTGDAETAADEAVTSLLISAGESGQNLALNGAGSMMVNAQTTPISELPYWSTHTLDFDRFTDIACLVYGSDPKTHAYLVEGESLSSEVAKTCPDKFAKLQSNVGEALKPHLKKKTA